MITSSWQTGARPRRARVVVLHPYWSFWAHTAGPTFREDRLRLARTAARALEPSVEITGVADFASAEEAAALAPSWAGGRVDALLVIQTMAVPSAFTMALLDRLAGVPVVVWAMHERGVVTEGFDHGSVTTQGATVGAPMLLNILARRGRAFDLVLGRIDVDATVRRVADALATAAAAGRIRRARLGRVGRPQQGYLHVDVDDGELQAATGITMVPVEPIEFTERFAAARSADVAALAAEVRAGWTFEEDVEDDDTFERSMRAAIALRDLCEAHDLDGGAFNCHVPEIRFGSAIGITPCWGLGWSTSSGRPWTCTGDVLTAVAMLTTKHLGGAALYHEIETLDYETGEVVIANSGEHDLAWLAPGERPRLRRNGWFCGIDPRCGVCAVFEPAPGPATLVGFTPHPEARGGFRYVVAPGELTARRFPESGTVNGAFRFASGPVEEAWPRWAMAGVNHHSSATPGDISRAVAGVARHLGIEAVLV